MKVAAKLARRKNAVEGGAGVGGKFEQRRDFCRLSCREPGARGPETARCLRPRRKARHRGEIFEMAGGGGIVFHAPRRETRIPSGALHSAAMRLQDGGGKRIGFLVLAFEEIGGDDALAHLVQFEARQRVAHIAAAKPGLCAIRRAARYHATNLAIDFAEARRWIFDVAVIDRIGRMHGLAPAARRGLLGPGGGPALAERELVDVGGARMVVIFGEPRLQLRIARDVVRAHIFDVEDMAHEALVLELRHQLVSRLEVPALGRRYDVAIEFAVGAAQDFRAPDAHGLLATCLGKQDVSGTGRRKDRKRRENK